MSLFSGTDRDVLTTIERKSGTAQGSEGEDTGTYTTGNRGTLVTTIRCRIQNLSAIERVQFGIAATERAWKWLFHSNPSLDLRDRATFTDDDEDARTAYVLNPSKNMDNQGRLWVAIAAERGTEE